MTTKGLSVGALACSTAAIAVAYGSAFLPGGAPAWAAWLLATAISVCMVAFMALGASRPGRGMGRLKPALALTFVLIAGCFALALAMPAETAVTRLWLGLPPRAAVLLYGIGLLPLFVLPFAYALTFEEQTLSEEDLARVRAAVAELKSGVGRGASGVELQVPRDARDDTPVAMTTPDTRRPTPAEVAP